MESNNLLTDIVGSGRYIIDAVGFYNLGKTACRIYMFSDDIDLYDPYSIMSYFVSLQTTSLYNNSVRDWLTLYSLSYLDQYIDDDIVHDWPVKLPDPPPSINFDDITISNFDKYNAELNVYAVGPSVSDAKYDEIVKQNILIYDFGQKGLLTWKQVKRVYNDFNINFDIKADYYLYKTSSNNDFSKNINLQIKDITDGTNNDILGVNYEFHYPFRPNVSGVFTKLELYFYYNGVKLLMFYHYWIGAKGMYGDDNRATQKCIIKLPKTFTIKAIKN
ncbi:MAG: hypothetical protein OHM56_01330 [Spiroplasma phoeniceum]|nr:MAG: hypothetical protein OHM57_00755 [Spiroplasma phoeniceum]UZQ32633.1 MAG: hypothetical protein OHM56_01330 [Spiroplasma phoeniceum]